MTKVRLGFHVSISGGISNSVDNAKEIGCTAFQIFSRNPRGWTAKPLDEKDVELFKGKLASSGIDYNSVMVHMPYLPNLSGSDGENYTKSIDTLEAEMRRCSELGVPHLVIHLGSHRGQDASAGISQLVKAIRTAGAKAEKAGNQHVTVLLENSAGQKNWVGSTFEELRSILDKLGDNSKEFGVCLDTCHLFAAGNDLRTKKGVETTLDKFENVVGLKTLGAIHLNDSKKGLNSHLDRHQHIGLGYIGRVGLAAFINHEKIRKLPIIMETPKERHADEKNLKTVLSMVRH
ncbi:MAG: deoxyribonuclease IV [Nitrososphaera sp.]